MIHESASMTPANPVNWNAYLSEKALEVTETQKENFRKKILPGRQQDFERLSPEVILTLVAMDSLSDSELLALIDYQERILRDNKKDAVVFGANNASDNLFRLNKYVGRKI